MDFSGLIYSYNRQESHGEPIQNKQHLNVSERTKAILLNDQDVFYIQNGYIPALKTGERKLSSRIINDIFRCYRDTAHASIGHIIKIEKSRVSDVLRDMDSEQRETAVNYLLNIKRDNLIREVMQLTKRKGYKFKFNIDKENIKYLVSDEAQCEKEFYSDSIGDYFKAVLEEYADLPYVERERVFFHNHIDSINSAILNKAILKIRLYTKNKNLRNGITSDNFVYMKPYKIITDSEFLYNYVVGITKSCDDARWSDESKISSIRLSSINECKCMENKESRERKRDLINGNTAAMIESEIQKRGVQFLSSDGAKKIIVKFTEDGEKMYQRILHLRPSYTLKNANREYEFFCTDEQASNYFFKFGHHVKIIEPVYLADFFGRKYRSAAKQYPEK